MVADSIWRGLEEALAYAEGKADTSRYSVHIAEAIDVKAIRAKLDMTQGEFAGRFGFSISTLCHWEQGRRVPEVPNFFFGRRLPPRPARSSSVSSRLLGSIAAGPRFLIC